MAPGDWIIGQAMAITVPRRRQRTLKLVGPEDDPELSDLLWPRLHARWWNRDIDKRRGKTVGELYAGLRCETREQARETLEHVTRIADSAIERAAAADRRATTIAGTVAIAASFTLGGAGIVVDSSKIANASLRHAFAIVLCATAAFFIASAIYALRALVATRTWKWNDPHELPLDPTEPREKQLGMRAAHTLHHFAYNWEISDLKNRNVDNALRALIAALLGIAALAGLLVWDTYV